VTNHQYYSHTRKEMFGFVPKNSKSVLEFGCGEGLFGEALQQGLGCRVTGVEIDAGAFSVAKTRLFRVYHSSVEAFLEHHGENYDVICFNDVLEHLVDPWTELRRCRLLLNHHGCVVASIPNLRFLHVLTRLLFQQDLIDGLIQYLALHLIFLRTDLG